MTEKQDLDWGVMRGKRDGNFFRESTNGTAIITKTGDIWEVSGSRKLANLDNRVVVGKERRKA